MGRLISGTAALLLAVLILLPGCGPSDASAAPPERGPLKVTFNLVNKSGGKAKDIGVLGAERPIGFRDLEDGATGSISHTEPCMPEWLEVNWTDHRGKRRAGTVKVWSELGQAYDGPVIMVINDRNKIVLRGE